MGRTTRIVASCGVVWMLAALALAAVSVPLGGAGRTFYDDDPLAREPETQDASRVQAWEIDLLYDLMLNLFTRPGDPAPNVRARNVNTIDEVPDSSWFTNRIGARPVSIEEAVGGPLTGTGPAPGTWTVVRAKESGFAPGFTMRDEAGTTWFVSFDARGYPEAATGAILVANKIFWTLGYWQVENYLIAVRSEQLRIADTAMVTPPSGKRRPMRRSDLDAVLRRAHRGADGSYRAVAGKALPGRVLGGFRYYGTRPDDPNDIVPHEHRRELRALKVFGAWTNLVDMKAGNTLDTLVEDGGRAVVRHYLQDVGSTFGTGANAPREYDEGWELLYEGDKALKRFVTLGFYLQPWQTVRYERHDAIGRFEGDEFDPTGWTPRVPTAAFLRARPDDTFWAARRVMAFSDDMIRAIVKTGQYSDSAAERHLADVLIKRRDRIGRAYLGAVNPLVGFALDASGVLTFENAAIAAGAAATPPGRYTARWFTFDNVTGDTRPIGEEASGPTTRLSAPDALAAAASAFVKVQVAAAQAAEERWTRPVDVYFRRSGNEWRLVGIERMP
jgi:hypothetical protein